VADGTRDEVRIQLQQRPAAPDRANVARAPRLGPIAVGQLAPEWLLSRWADGRIRTLAEYRDRVVVLYFWNIAALPSVSQLPAVAQLRNGFEPRGVVFIAIHEPGEDETQVRKVLDFKQSLLLYAIDLQNPVNRRGVFGATTLNYGVRRLPATIVIDRQGKVAFNTDAPVKNPQPPAGKNARTVPDEAMTEQERNELFRTSLALEIEKVLTQKN
jgi:peroxiredoxin